MGHELNGLLKCYNLLEAPTKGLFTWVFDDHDYCFLKSSND